MKCPDCGCEVYIKKHGRGIVKRRGKVIDVKDIEKVYEMISEAGLNTTKDTVHFLPFWENGVKFFTIEGPNKEKVEFSNKD